MTEKQSIFYLNYRCSSCDTYHEWEDDIDEDAIIEAKHMAEHKIKIYEHDMFHLMQDYESIMGESYNIKYFVFLVTRFWPTKSKLPALDISQSVPLLK